MEFRILGPLQVVEDGEPLDVGPRKQRVLLALLAVNANRVVTTDRILEELWGEEAEGKENALWVYISRLRAALGGSDVLVTGDHGYSLVVDEESIDVRLFEKTVAEGRSVIKDDPTAASELLSEGLGMWRGPVLQEFGYAEFAQAEGTRLDALRVSALEDRIDADLRRGLAGELIGELEVLQQAHPLREKVISQLMLALYRAGRQGEALRAFERFRLHLAEEVGLEPSPELRRLEEQILLHDSRIQARRPAVGTVAASRVAAGAVNPFKGLRAFLEDDTDDFFGRDRLIAEVVRRLDAGTALVSLVGPSGSGKSSIARAGVIPALRKGAIEGSNEWLIAQMVPGSQPFAELEAALLRTSLDAPDSLSDQLADPEAGVLRAALRVLPSDTARLVLVIDQFEELFTLVEDETRRARFLTGLLGAGDDSQGRVKVILTLRADFYDRPLAYPEFGARLGEGIVNVVPFRPDELEAAAQAPAERAGVNLEPALVAALLTDVVGQPGGLPLFQYALTELFDRRAGDTLSLSTYHLMDGVRGALSRRADDLFAQLDDEQQVAARQLFLRLVTIAEGDEWGRRRVPASEIISLDVDIVSLQTVIDAYTDHRLLTLDRDPVTDSPIVEVAHEALLTEWGRLREWIETARQDVKRHAALTSAMSEWLEADRNPDYLLTGARLERYEQWAATATMQLTAAEHGYIDTAVQQRARADEVEEQRRAQEAKTERSARRRLWALTMTLALLVGGALTLLLVGGSDVPTIFLVAQERTGDEVDLRAQVISGFEQAAREFDFDDVLVTPLSDVHAEVDALLETSPGLVILPGPVVRDVDLDLKRLVDAHPEVSFALLDSEFFDDVSRLSAVEFAVEEGSFLVGAAAALKSQTEMIGFVGGLAGSVDEFRAGFEAGARYVKPDIEVISTNLFEGGADVWASSESQEAAVELYRAGADVVFHAAGIGGRGVLEVAADQSDELGRHLWAIGVDVDEWLHVDDPVREHVLTSMLERWDLGVRVIIEQYLDGTLVPGPIRLDASNRGVDHATTGGHIDEHLQELERIRQEIIDGTISVPSLPSGPPTHMPEPTHSVTATFNGDGCRASPPTAVTVGDVVRVDFVNDFSQVSGVSIVKVEDGTTLRAISSHPDGISAFTDGTREGFVFARGNARHAFYTRLLDPGTYAINCFDVGLVGHPAAVFETAELSPDDADHEARVSFDGSTCGFDPALNYELGSVIAVEVENTSDLRAGVDLWRVLDGTTLSDWASRYSERTTGLSIHGRAFVDPREKVTLTARLDRPGTWMVRCFIPFGQNFPAAVFSVV